jgi:hypothetical protein
MSATDAPLGRDPRPSTEAPLSDPLWPDLLPGIHRFASRSATAALRRRLSRTGWAVAVVDLAGSADKLTVLDAFARGLAFPGWVGHNWDALDDALRDLSWWPAGPRGRVIVIRGAARSTTGTPRDREQLQDVMTNATARWAATETPLVVLLRR